MQAHVRRPLAQAAEPPAAAVPRVRVRVPAKVNLALSVGERRPDGFHDVRTVLQAVSLFDRVEATPDVRLRLTAPGRDVPDGAENLAWRAASTLAEATGREPRVHLRLAKSIPVAAGLGGGSADAAATLVACNRLWGCGLTRHELAHHAASLGSDVPFFLWGGTARGDGRGERVTPLAPLPAWPCVLAVAAERKSSTAAAYARLDRLRVWPRPDVERVLLARTPRELAAAVGNSFSAIAGPAPPAAGAYAAVLAGSGNGFVVLGPSRAWARRVTAELRATDGWQAWACRFWPSGAEVLG